MRVLMIVAVLAATADADPIHPRMTLGGGRLGAAQLDGATGMAVGVFGSLGAVVGATSVELEVGIGSICRGTGDDSCDGPLDTWLALHGRHRIGTRGAHMLWFGGGPAAHRIKSVSRVAARGEIERSGVSWQPGLDLLLAIELRDRDRSPVGGHLGLRAFVLRSDERTMAKPFSPPDPHGIDGGLVLEAGYVYGR